MASEIRTLRDENQALKQLRYEQEEKIRKLEQQVLDLSVSLSAACNETAEFKDMLRLANDKMAEQVRQARREVACAALDRSPTYIYKHLCDVRDANAAKD